MEDLKKEEIGRKEAYYEWLAAKNEEKKWKPPTREEIKANLEKIEKEKQDDIAWEKKQAAIDSALDRYKNKSRFYKMFHKRMSSYEMDKLSIDRINNLYTENKGRSK